MVFSFPLVQSVAVINIHKTHVSLRTNMQLPYRIEKYPFYQCQNVQLSSPITVGHINFLKPALNSE